MIKKALGIIGVAGVFLLNACHSSNLYSDESSVDQVKVIAGEVTCMLGEKPSAHWIQSLDELTPWWRRIYQMQLPQPPLPELNLAGNGLVLISMGQKNTAGYALALSGQPLQRQNNIASIYVDWKQPQPGMLQAQMLSSPCILIQLATTNIRQINIVDQDNSIRFTLSRPSSN